jgi:hypothetical protein
MGMISGPVEQARHGLPRKAGRTEVSSNATVIAIELAFFIRRFGCIQI